MLCTGGMGWLRPAAGLRGSRAAGAGGSDAGCDRCMGAAVTCQDGREAGNVCAAGPGVVAEQGAAGTGRVPPKSLCVN